MVPASNQAGYASRGPGVSAAGPEPSLATTQIRLAIPETVEPFGPEPAASRPLMYATRAPSAEKTGCALPESVLWVSGRELPPLESAMNIWYAGEPGTSPE